MLISRTPFRISFFGGGTDYPAWYLKEGGAVLSTTIDKYCYLNCRYLPHFEVKHRIVWSHIETVNSISEILHPAVREGMRLLGFDDTKGLEIHYQGDLPARAGMGSSSAFSVGLVNALMSLQGRSLGKKELALKAIELEQDVLKECGGSQDQIAAAFGGFNLILFGKNGDIKVEPVMAPKSRLFDLESHLMLIYTGANRLASEVARNVVANMSEKRETLLKIRRLVDESLSILTGSGDLDAFGRLLHESWILKRDLSSGITNSRIDIAYETAIKHGALGGKLLGAGGAGFMLFYVPIEKQEEVKRALTHYVHVPFKFETQGSVIIYNGEAWRKYGG